MRFILTKIDKIVIFNIVLLVALIGFIRMLFFSYQTFNEIVNNLSLFSFTFSILSIIILVKEYYTKLGLINKIDRLNLDAVKIDNRIKIQNNELEMKDQDFIEFVFSVTHDLKAPLRSIQGYANAINEDYSDVLDIYGKQMLYRINYSVIKMDKLIQDLLLYNKIGYKELRFINLDLKILIRDAIRENIESIIKNNVSIKLELPVRCVYGSNTLLDKIIANLIGNAIKFSANKDRPKINIWSEDKPNFVRLNIQDNGIGIEEKNFEKIFNVFERLHSEEQYPGTGIGLSIVKKGIERMNGRFGVESVPSEYSIFWIELSKCMVPN